MQLVTLSKDNNELFKRIFRKVLVITYKENCTVTDIMFNYSLTDINNEVEDADVHDFKFRTYGASITYMG